MPSGSGCFRRVWSNSLDAVSRLLPLHDVTPVDPLGYVTVNRAHEQQAPHENQMATSSFTLPTTTALERTLEERLALPSLHALLVFEALTVHTHHHAYAILCKSILRHAWLIGTRPRKRLANAVKSTTYGTAQSLKDLHRCNLSLASGVRLCGTIFIT